MSSLPKVKLSGGDFFLNEDNSEFNYVGSSEFGDWKRFNLPNGPEALVRPNLTERKLVRDSIGYKGPVVNRVFRYSDPGNPFGILPSQVDFSKVNAFLDLCAEYNVYVDWTCGDSQKSYMLPNVNDQQKWLDDFCANVSRFCFMETCNEPFKNGQLPQNGVKPHSSEWYLRDSGNYVFINDNTVWEYQYDLDFISFHGDRNNDPIRWPKWVCDLDDSISTLRSKVNKPAVLKEPNKFGPYYTDPSYARILGLRANMGGVTFHYQKGLESNGFDEASKVAYGEFFRGVKGSLGL
jgi:hypothetical protein